jgi:hypothetical protein
MKKIVTPINPMPDGSCRTIKAQYQQSSLANFIRGVGREPMIMEIVYESNSDRQSPSRPAELQEQDSRKDI